MGAFEALPECPGCGNPRPSDPTNPEGRWTCESCGDQFMAICEDCEGKRGHHGRADCPSLLARCRELGVAAVRHAAQKDFVNNPNRASAYIGGLGSGKTFAGIARGLKFSQQPMKSGMFHGPRGAILAINYPVLDDVIMPQFFEMMDGAGLWKTGKQETSYLSSKRRARLIANCGCADRHRCKHEASILFRSLDRPNWMRGLELSWYFIDEGRHVNGKAWAVLWGRLRQTGFEKAGWVCSTPNGFDWEWEKFHPDSPLLVRGSVWFGASTYDNADHLPNEYIDELFKEYEGAFLRQEVFGEFIGVTEGAVFFNFAPDRCVIDVPYRNDLELYSMWDFGMGDLGVCSFAQVDWKAKRLPSGDTEWVPVGRLIGCIEATDWVSEEWATAFKAYCAKHFGGRLPSLNVGDPAGKSRSPGKRTSIIEDLAQHDVTIVTPQQKPQDYAVRILTNMMEADRIVVDRSNAARLGAAISSHRWKVDDNGIRTGTLAVHDWTSHYCDGLRYWATIMFSVFPKRDKKPDVDPPGPGTAGYLKDQLLRAKPGEWLGNETIKDPLDDWEPGLLEERGGRLYATGK